MTNDNAIMMMFVMNIIGISYVFLMNGAGIIERLKCIFYYESKSAPFNNRTHIKLIFHFISLRAQRIYGRALACIKHFNL